MNVWKIVCATLVIFLAGIATGVVLVRIGERGPKPWGRGPRTEIVNRPQTNAAHNPNLPPLNNPNRPNDPPAANPGNPNSGPMSREFVQGLERQLRLSPEQREQVNRIMAEGQERIRELRKGIDPEIRREMQKTHEQIQSLLTPEQREQFQRLMKLRSLRRNEAPTQPDRRFREPRNAMPPSDDARNTEQPKTP